MKVDKGLFDKYSKNFNILVVGKKDEFTEKLLEEINTLSKRKVLFHYVDEINKKNLYTFINLADLAIFYRINEAEKNGEIINLLINNHVPVINLNGSLEHDCIPVEIENEPLENVSAFIVLALENRRLRRKLIEYQIKKGKELGIYSDPEILFQIEGSFDSSYSLAIVNREVARALNKMFPGRVALYSTDGYGDFPPNEEFLRKNPDVAEMWKKSVKGLHAPVVMRNPYPVRIYDMKGIVNSMTSYGWEESEYPKHFLNDMNLFLDLLPVMSPYVKKVMIDNGILIPAFVVGLGAEHIQRLKPKEYKLKTKKKFKFLHISSCFPRKGVDILLEAYTSAFTSEDDVVLIIKTFPNPHNNVEEMIERLKNTKRNCPEIELINEDLPDEYIVDLYRQANCFVLPSRGEGFGLPAAEAMLFKIPVIATGYGGHTYFCKPDTAWLIDYKFAKAKTHMELPNSVWAEPSKEHLAQLMRKIYEAKPEDLRDKVEKAYNLIKEKFTWEKTAKRILKAIETTKNLPVFLKKDINVGWISTWNVRCGIAQYSKYLLQHFPESFKVLKIANNTPQENILSEDEEKNVFRTWNRIQEREDIDKILKIIEENSIEFLIIQYHPSFISVKALGSLINAVKTKDIPVFIFFHTLNTYTNDESLDQIIEDLKKADRLFVHSINDLNKFKEWNLVDNVSLFPHGVRVEPLNRELLENLRKELSLENKIVVGSFGYLREHKGIVELIEAFKEIRNEKENIHLLLLNSLYPSEDSKVYYELCYKLIHKYNLSDSVTFITEFVPDEYLKYYIGLMDVVVFPYQYTGESSSAAVRYPLAYEKRVICTPLPIFEDVSDMVFFTEGFSPKHVARAIEEVLENPNAFKEKLKIIKKWKETFNWEKISERLQNMILYFVNYAKIEPKDADI